MIYLAAPLLLHISYVALFSGNLAVENREASGEWLLLNQQSALQPLTPRSWWADKPRNLTESTRNSMVNHLLLSYDKTQRAQVDEEMLLTVNFYVEGMSKVNQVNMDYQMTIFFRQVKK